MCHLHLLYITWVIGHLGLSISEDTFHESYDSCKGNRQTLVIPRGYDKDVPDSYETDIATLVEFGIYIVHLRGVNEKW